jgi:hypothetical protein
VELDKAGKGAVVCLFYLRGEDAGGKLIILEVIGDAVAALALAGAGFVAAGASGLVGVQLAFHDLNSYSDVRLSSHPTQVFLPTQPAL